MKMSWSPEGDLQFWIFKNKGQKLKYARKESTHTPVTLCAIPWVVLNHLKNQPLRKYKFYSKCMDTV